MIQEDWLKIAPRGAFDSNVTLGFRTWLKVGGSAEYFFQPQDQEDLALVLQQYPKHSPLFCLGVGSNVLIRDGGVSGLVIYLGKTFRGLEKLDPHRFQVDSGVRSLQVARQAAQWGLAGLSFLAGIPGSIGGALAMNAGAHGGETYEHLESIQWMDREGKIHFLTKGDLEFGYRSVGLKGGIFLSAIFCCPHGTTKQLNKEISDVQARRTATQPIGQSTGGSTFKNPSMASPVNGQVQHAWQWIDAAGCRGLRIGGAEMSQKHCNFMINTGGARAKDLERLGGEVQQRVYEQFGISLEWEIHIIGREA